MPVNVPVEAREPFYFGTPEKPLFGCYHPPQAGPVRDCGIILCYPMGQEYMRSHRSYLQLAVRLTRVGFPVLRFDFYGCGDSGGDSEEWNIRQWLNDISTAITELKKRSRSAKVCLVGLRLGATLAMMAAAERGDIHSLVLWEPLVSGDAYVAELKALHKEMLRFSYVSENRSLNGKAPSEILGFSLPESIFADLKRIDLLAIQRKPANNVLLTVNDDGANVGRLAEHLKNVGAQLEYQCLPTSKIWLEEPYKGLVPHQLWQAVITWISEVQ